MTPPFPTRRSAHLGRKHEIVHESSGGRYWELRPVPGKREATVLRGRMDRESEMAARVGEISAPTLILFGDKDRVINPSAAKTFNERIAGSEVVMLPGIGQIGRASCRERVCQYV